MASIIRLDDITINQIAAGEVVERPASVVKELTENAIDAGSTAVTIEILEGGLEQIRITDNGCGMDDGDALLSFERHATSKIRQSSDLSKVLSLGFRGEALASIAAVSKVEMLTRPRGSASGTRILNQGGEIRLAQAAGCPEGTTILVSSLFYNTPARLKFLKPVRSEASAVSELAAKLILAHPEISFKYIHQGKIIYHSAGNGDLNDAIYSIYGREVRNNLLPLEASEPERNLRLWGRLGSPGLARSNRNYQSFFVNGRYIKSSFLSDVLEEAYKERITIHRHPWAVLHMEIPPQQVDVNVHPAKTEIRFKHEASLGPILLAWVKEAADRKPCIPNSIPAQSASAIPHAQNEDQERPEQRSFFVRSTMPISQDPIHESMSGNINESHASEASIVYINSTDAGKNLDSRGMKDENLDDTIEALDILKGRVIGHAFSTYILVQGEETLFIVDQHAAHERLVYERFKAMIDAGQTISQQRLPPVVLEVTHSDFILIQDNLDLFRRTGFELEPFGNNAYLVRGVPMLLKDFPIQGFFNRLIDAAQKGGRTAQSALMEEDIIKLSCKTAVKAGDRLSDPEILRLLQDIQAGGIPLTCPHGRPILISMSRYELEKRFMRIQ